ncbi:MAG: bifunctional 5,10-methylene-tetrahydrofolate dehydrogenase/5,10-methylene-tetrahydrofolate cyclohydrolase [Ignavibacteriae bacterium]|nr:MAG: bifunctional 5,10-methylene-tetrahydrofolate dehydrogenase/5,10-methylene-tetrahydrofolate cyclohydrolase [Ignavibacteriota bacterium]
MEVTDKKIIDGKRISEEILEEVKREVKEKGIKPGIALILVGNDPASEIYVRNKGKTCEALGFHSVIEKREDNCSEEELLALIEKYNNDKKIHGILVQLPLPKHINEMKVIEAVNYKKDVDGFHPINAGKLMIGEKCFVPCTPAGIMELIKRYNIETAGKNVVVIGRSNIVGKPIGNLLLQKDKNANSTVTFCHSYTKDIASHTRNADIIIAAIGKALFLKADMIKEGCAIIDVGINKIEDLTKKSGQRTVGDVDFVNCYPKVSMITPVPKGVGPMTIAMLMKNTLDSATKKVYN